MKEYYINTIDLTNAHEWKCTKDIPEQERVYLFVIGAANLYNIDCGDLNTQKLDSHCWKLIEALVEEGYEPTDVQVGEALDMLVYSVGEGRN